MNKIVLLLLVSIVFSVSACTGNDTVFERLGYWVDEKPLRGTREATKFNKHPYWQCIENTWSTHNIKECD